MTTDKIYEGFKFMDGSYTEHIVTCYNGSIVYTYDYDDDGVTEMAYTRNEIADMMKEWDGKNHSVVWEQPMNVSLTHDGFDIDLDADEDGDVFSVFVKPSSSAWWEDGVDLDSLEEALDFIREAKGRGEE